MHLNVPVLKFSNGGKGNERKVQLTVASPTLSYGNAPNLCMAVPMGVRGCRGGTTLKLLVYQRINWSMYTMAIHI